MTPKETAPNVTVTFQGHELTTAEGQTVAAALMKNGISAWRTTRKHGKRRGLFCGIGVCYDCLLTIDGVPAQRACLVEVCDGMELTDPTVTEGEEDEN